MAKQVVAAVNIMHNGESYPANTPLDPQKFTKEQLTRLYERAAVKIVDSSEVEKQDATLEDVDTGMAAPPSVPSEKDAKKSETEKAEARSAMKKQENDPNANTK